MTPGFAPARPFFLPVGPRTIFCLHHVPVGTACGAVVYVPPLAEEMNKSRRMAALQARALAAAGWHVLQMDCSGTGDSSGDFSDASWPAWVEEVDAARRWLAEASSHEPWLWGLRLGGLLAACSFAFRPTPGCGLVLWQPVLSGRQHLQQFLRVRAGAEWLGNPRSGPPSGDESVAQQTKPLDQLKAGQPVEVAGYTLSSGLAMPLADAELCVPPDLSRLVLLEVSPREGATLSPAAARLLASAHAPDVRSAVVRGPSFWQAQEIETAPELVPATVRAMAP